LPPLLLKIRFVQPRRGQGFDAADDEQVLQGASRKPAAMDLEHVGVESKLFDPHQLLQVDVSRQVQPALINGSAALKNASELLSRRTRQALSPCLENLGCRWNKRLRRA
jgi:hypothetical protein